MRQVKQSAEWHFLRGLSRNGTAEPSLEDQRTNNVESGDRAGRTDMIAELGASLDGGPTIVVIVLAPESAPHRLG